MIRQETCYCNAYLFPHRVGSGKCRRDSFNRVNTQANVASTLNGYDGWRWNELLARRVADARR